MRITRVHVFVLGIAATFLAPLVIPGTGLDYIYFFIMVLVLSAWFSIKWTSVRSLASRGRAWEIGLGSGLVAADYAVNIYFHSTLGILDLLVIFGGLIVAFYGVRAFKLFWVPTTYGIILLLGYQIEILTPNFVALQDWMASVMASSMQVLGIMASVSGHYVTIGTNSGPLELNVEGDCTGIQGILAFGMLSTMTLLDVKPKMTKLIPLFVIGFLGAFFINILRLFVVFLSFEYLGVEAGTTVHVYLGYMLFIAWVLVFWSLAFRYLNSKPPSTTVTSAVSPSIKPPF